MKNLQINHAIVAFIDILGFGERLRMAQCSDDLPGLYQEIKRLHRIFEKDAVEELVTESHAAMSKSVISFSDAVVISVDFKSPYAQCTPKLDVQATVLDQLAAAQAEAVLKGSFVRGGVALGYYCNSDDVLLSNALVSAYALESSACFPVIAVDKTLASQMLNDEENTSYASGSTPADLLIDLAKNPRTGEIIYFLDYFEVARSRAIGYCCNEDIDRYRAAKTSDEKQCIINESYSRSELQFVDAHAEVIRVELAKNHKTEVKKKYEWLRDYHNRSVEKNGYGANHKV